MGKYTPLGTFLGNSPVDDVYLTFDQIEQLIDDTLPPSAYRHAAWWSNDRHTHPQSAAWLAVGWEKERADLRFRVVHFRRRQSAPRPHFQMDLFDERDGEVRTGMMCN